MTDTPPDPTEWWPDWAREAAAAYPTEECYTREGKQRQHFRIAGFDITGFDTERGAEVTASCLHGKDSPMAGVTVDLVPLADLARCGCGKWEMPTAEDLEGTVRKLKAAALRKRRAQGGEMGEVVEIDRAGQGGKYDRGGDLALTEGGLPTTDLITGNEGKPTATEAERRLGEGSMDRYVRHLRLKEGAEGDSPRAKRGGSGGEGQES